MNTAEAKRSSEPAPVAKPPTAAQPAAPVAKKRRPFAILGGLVAVGLIAAGVYSWATAGRQSTDDAQVESDTLPVAPRVSGSVRKVYVADNQKVKRGDLLLEIDDADLQVRVLQANAELAVAQAQAAAAHAQEEVVNATATGGLHSAKAQVSSSQVGVQSAGVQIEFARASLSRAQTDARKTELDLRRTRELHDRHAVSQDVLDSAQLSYDQTQAALVQARAQLAAAEDARAGAISRVADAQGKLAASTPTEALIAAAHAQSELAQARVKAAQAAAQLVQLQLSYTKLAAPQDGVISRLGVRDGQLVSENQPLAVLVPSSTYLVANFKETQIGKMRAGDIADVELDAYPGQHFEAVVESLSGGTGARFSLLPPDNASGNFVKVVQRVPVRLTWRAIPNVALQAGLSADVTVTVHGD
ncbi:MAG TPA: HlyD family secretion protein [Polyangiales bacterium]